MGQALYRKHRPKSLKEVIGQEHITDTLGQALKQGRISHAYLFTGPRGVGKTSIARIWAHEINQLPYTDDSTHMDIIEIDAASNRRIDEIRELRDKVYVAPTSAKYKVYIIDEVHMLTREAFNALLKTLEEPPAHVVFILATTDAHKLPDTIISRAQRFSFKPVEPAKVIAHLRQIAQTEKIDVADDALALLADHGEGSFRDSISLLDQASSQASHITLEDVERLLGIPPAEALDGLWQALRDDAASSVVMQALTGLYGQGYQAAIIAKRLGQKIRAQLIEGSAGIDGERALRLLGQLIEVPVAHDPERFLEITVLGALPRPAMASRPAPVPLKEVTAAEPAAELPKSPKPAVIDPNAVLDPASWPQILQALKQRHNTLYGVVRMAEPDFSEPGQVTLAFAFAFHQKRITENSNQQKLADIIKESTGKNVRLICILDKNAAPPKAPAANSEEAPVTPDLAAISNIFGDAELLES
jgi:DNA polymerase III subunit gamma/tau